MDLRMALAEFGRQPRRRFSHQFDGALGREPVFPVRVEQAAAPLGTESRRLSDEVLDLPKRDERTANSLLWIGCRKARQWLKGRRAAANGEP